VTGGSLIRLRDPEIHEAASGIVTLAGRTNSSDIVRTPVGYDTTFNSTSSTYADAYVAIVDPSKSGLAGLVYDTYFGADLDDSARALAVDSAGVVTLGGWTDSATLPITPGAFGTTFLGPTDLHDAFLARLDPSLPQAQQLVYSTFLAGDGYENVLELVLDSRGRILAQGYTGNTGLVSNTFPTTCDAYQPGFAGEHDGYLVYLDPAGNGADDLLYSTFVGGATWDILMFGLELLSESPTLRVLTAGGSYALGFPTTSGAYQQNPGGGYDGLILQLEVAGSAEVVRAGTPPNPTALLPGVTSGPVLGSTWDPVIDHTSFLPGAVMDALGITVNPLELTLPPFGTLLCDLARTLSIETSPPGVPFAVAVPFDCQLAGVNLTTQGAAVDASGAILLTNALDITLGSF
jgi:hypothetical protein